MLNTQDLLEALQESLRVNGPLPVLVKTSREDGNHIGTAMHAYSGHWLGHDIFAISACKQKG